MVQTEKDFIHGQIIPGDVINLILPPVRLIKSEDSLNKSVEKKSVKKELQEISAELKVESELKKAQNVKEKGNTPVLKNDNIKKAKVQKERGK